MTHGPPCGCSVMLECTALMHHAERRPSYSCAARSQPGRGSLIEDARPTRAGDGCAVPTAKQVSDMERYLSPSHQSTRTTRHMIRRLSSPTFSPGLWTPAMAITQAIHCNAVDRTRAAHSHDGGSCCRAADAPGGPGLSAAHDSCPSRPVGPLGGPGDGPGAGAPHIVVGGRQAEATTF